MSESECKAINECGSAQFLLRKTSVRVQRQLYRQELFTKIKMK